MLSDWQYWLEKVRIWYQCWDLHFETNLKVFLFHENIVKERRVVFAISKLAGIADLAD